MVVEMTKWCKDGVGVGESLMLHRTRKVYYSLVLSLLGGFFWRGKSRAPQPVYENTVHAMTSLQIVFVPTWMHIVVAYMYSINQ